MIRTILLFLMALALCPRASAGQVAAICFTPGEDCTGLIIGEINRAQKELLVQAYTFTSAPIAKAVADARRRGVRTLVVLDKSQGDRRYSAAGYLARAGVPVLIDGQHAIAHNKVMVIDRARTLTGSFNFTKAAQESNAENVVVIDGSDVAGRYAANIGHHVAHSLLYGR